MAAAEGKQCKGLSREWELGGGAAARRGDRREAVTTNGGA